MQVYRATLTLLDYVFYATVERGKIYETGSFIHNYALAYAFCLASGVPYAQMKQEPHYQEELAHLEGIAYLTPAAPRQIAHRLVQWNTIRETYAFPGKSPSVGYPDWGFARVLRPGSQFIFYALVENLDKLSKALALFEAIQGRPIYIRLGKFLGKARVTMERADNVRRDVGPFVTRALLNWRDLPIEPSIFDVLATSLPTRLLDNAHFDGGDYYRARFGHEEIDLPASMHFLRRG